MHILCSISSGPSALSRSWKNKEDQVTSFVNVTCDCAATTLRLRQLRFRYPSNTHHDSHLIQFINTGACTFVHQCHHGGQHEIYPSGNARLFRRAKRFNLHTTSPILPGQPISSRAHESRWCPQLWLSTKIRGRQRPG